MFEKIFKTRKQREHESKIAEQKRLIELAKENGIYIPDAYEPSKEVSVHYKRIIGMPPGWYTSLDTRARIAERELKKKGLI